MTWGAKPLPLLIDSSFRSESELEEPLLVVRAYFI